MLEILFYRKNKSKQVDMKMDLLFAPAFLIHSHMHTIVLCTSNVWILQLQQSKIVFHQRDYAIYANVEEVFCKTYSKQDFSS